MSQRRLNLHKKRVIQQFISIQTMEIHLYIFGFFLTLSSVAEYW